MEDRAMAKKTKATKAKTRQSWVTLPPETLVAVARFCDGHTIFKPSAFADAGVPKVMVEFYTDTFKSNRSDYKSTIFVNGEPVDAVEGIYGLSVLDDICRDLGLTVPDKIGRGSQAAACSSAILAHFAKAEEEVYP